MKGSTNFLELNLRMFNDIYLIKVIHQLVTIHIKFSKIIYKNFPLNNRKE